MRLIRFRLFVGSSIFELWILTLPILYDVLVEMFVLYAGAVMSEIGQGRVENGHSW